MPLEYSDRAKIGYAELYKSLNEKTIFIEDEAGRIIYERIFSKIVGEGRIKRVFPLNGRDLVLDDWRKNRGRDDYIYIIDGDLDLWFGSAVEIGNLFQHERYAIENFLLSEDGFFDVIQDYDNGKKDRSHATSLFRSKVEELERHFSPLFVLYAIAHYSRIGERTVKEGVLRFFKAHELDAEALARRKKQLMRAIVDAIGYTSYKEIKNFIKSHIQNGLRPIELISAKDFVFPVLHKVAEREFKYTGRCDVLVRQISRHVEPDEFPRMAEFLRRFFR